MNAEETVFDMDDQCVTDPDQRACAAAALARIVERDWPEGQKRQLPTLLLRALCDLAASTESQDDDGWEPLAIAQAMVNLGAHWPKLTEEDARLRINSHWKNLEPLWRDRRDSVVERLAGDGLDLEPRLEKLTGGGAGKRTRYRLQFFPLTTQLIVKDQRVDLASDSDRMPVTNGGHVIASPTRGIHYYSVPIEVPAILRFTDPTDRLPADDVIGRLLVFLPMLDPIRGFGNVAMQALLLPVLLFYWSRLARKRVIRAPIWLQPFSLFRGNVFELLPAPTTPGATPVKLSRYVADCPICGADGNGRSSIRPASGGREFHGRIVGRCAHAPQEHVWSFDHIARTGRFLR